MRMSAVRSVIGPGELSGMDGILQGGGSIHHRQIIMGSNPGHMVPAAVAVFHTHQQKTHCRLSRQLQQCTDQAFKAAHTFRRFGVVHTVFHHHYLGAAQCQLPLGAYQTII